MSGGSSNRDGSTLGRRASSRGHFASTARTQEQEHASGEVGSSASTEVAAASPATKPVLKADTATQVRLAKEFRNLIRPGRSIVSRRVAIEELSWHRQRR